MQDSEEQNYDLRYPHRREEKRDVTKDSIGEYCDLIRSKAIDVLEWYYRDGSVGGACDPMEALREVIGVTEEWLCRK
jgi:hypothetical protein